MKKSTLRAALEMVTGGSEARVPEVLRAEAIARHEETQPWRTSDQVQGYGIGRRITRGERLSDLALKVYVERKKPRKELGPETVPARIMMPGLGAEIETDVEEIGRIELEADTMRHRPAMPGCGVGHPAISVGTFGCLVRKKSDPKTLYILSNSHVLADSGIAAIGDKILQPGSCDGGQAPKDIIGELAEFVPFRFNGAFSNLVDAALARVKLSVVTSRIRILGIPPSGLGVARIGTRVKKVGRTTDFTIGEVIDTDFKTSLQFKKPGGGIGFARFTDQVLCTRYTAGGDSGSAVLHEKSNKLLGLHFAGSMSSSIFNKIHNVVEALDIEIVTTPL